MAYTGVSNPEVRLAPLLQIVLIMKRPGSHDIMKTTTETSRILNCLKSKDHLLASVIKKLDGLPFTYARASRFETLSRKRPDVFSLKGCGIARRNIVRCGIVPLTCANTPQDQGSPGNVIGRI